MSQKVRQHSLQITSFLIMNGQAKCTTLIKNRSSEEPIHGRIQPHCNNLSFEDEREFSYQSGSKNGPEHWGEIHEDWSICGKGKMQSPIDLSHDRVQVVHHLGRLRRTYRPANAVMMNRGHDIMLKWEEEAGGVILYGTEYQIKQLHWHAPSEHSINGRRYDLELHMVHESADKKIAVIGIMYKLGRPDTLLAKMEDYVRKLEDIKDGEEKVGMVNPREVKWGSRKYYRYMGPLTTSPCTEGVIWHIINKVRTVSKEQLHMLREAVHDVSVIYSETCVNTEEVCCPDLHLSFTCLSLIEKFYMENEWGGINPIDLSRCWSTVVYGIMLKGSGSYLHRHCLILQRCGLILPVQKRWKMVQ